MRDKQLPKDKSINRANQISYRDDNVIPDLSVGLEDIDNAIRYYFLNIIKPQVIDENDNIINVPVIYANSEKWKSVRRDGFLRDNRGKLQIPLIAYKRTSISKNTNIPLDKLDANNPRVYKTIHKRWNSRNKYDQFSVLHNQWPSTESYNVVVPDYVNVGYSVIMWTDYIKQMNSLVEALEYSEGSYWGDKEKFKFKCSFSDITDTSDAPSDGDRFSKAEISMTVEGYLIPKTYNKEMSMMDKSKTFGTKKILTLVEVVTSKEMENLTFDEYVKAQINRSK